MRQFVAFLKKEGMELIRGGKLIFLLILFVLVGIFNPAMAKLTPAILEMVSDQMAESGIVVADVVVTAKDSWTQFYKNIPITLIVFVIMMCGIFTTEYQRSTLVNMVTKGLDRWKILISKLLVTEVLWTLGYFGCFGITYGYTAYFWDNSVVNDLALAAVLYWLCGVWILSVIPLASAFFSASSQVMLSAGAAYLIPFLLSMIPKIKVYLPTHLMDSMDLLLGSADPEDYLKALAVTGILFVANIVVSIIGFNRRKL